MARRNIRGRWLARAVVATMAGSLAGSVGLGADAGLVGCWRLDEGSGRICLAVARSRHRSAGGPRRLVTGGQES